MGVREELRDPWGWLVAGVTGGVGWAVLGASTGALAAAALPVGVAIGAAVLGTKVAVGALTGSRSPKKLEYADRTRPDELPVPAPGSPAATLLARGDAAVRRISALSEAPGDPWLRDQVSDVDDESAEALAALREVGGRVTLVEQSMAGSDVRRLDAETARLTGSAAAATDDRLRAETQRAMAAVAQQREVAVRLGTLRDTLLARMETAVLGLEGLAARMGEVVALGATAIEHDKAAGLVDSLTSELETMRAGLDDARALADPPGDLGVAALPPPPGTGAPAGPPTGGPASGVPEQPARLADPPSAGG
jgi:hypothetical protein